MKKIKKFFRIWLLTTKNAALSQLTNVYAAIFFTLGKIIRFLFLFAFLFVIVRSAASLTGYTPYQVILFFLVFNLVDITAQFLFRAVYSFRPLVVEGGFDFYLVKPLPSFWRPLFGWGDIFDFFILVPLWIFTLYFVLSYGLVSAPIYLVYFFILYLASILIAFAFHLFVASVCVITTEVDHLILVYRDLIGMTRVPTDIYQREIRWFLTFVIPVAVMVTVPVKALLGLLSFWGVVLTFLASLILVWLSLKFWQFALIRYSSASS